MADSFVGRTAELELIRALLEEGEGPTAAVVLGDPGAGKSRLLTEATRASVLPTFRVVGYERERLVPLAAASQLL
ncbi:MAG TPA: ATP-binding protein, partial [Acidimicrobiia bacterium]|nr:ATP-binding protein [Acidimicrobiia bacterium]